MRIGDERESSNVEDMRGVRSRYSGRGLRLGGGRLGIGTIAIALVASYFLGLNPLEVLGLLSGGGMQVGAPEQVQQSGPPQPLQDEKAIFVSKVLATTEDTWDGIFRESRNQYQAPKLVLFTDSFPTACGMGESAAGPFYCPVDRKVYIDLSFYQLMRERFHASGDFAEAYVIAHEVGHHVQNLLGLTDKMQSARRRVSEREYNALSVRLELQADCFAGVWANRTDQSKRILEPGDVESAVKAASAIGDDALQRQARGYVVPDSFTHGTSEQRVRWLRTGLASGNPKSCDTFNAASI